MKKERKRIKVSFIVCAVFAALLLLVSNFGGALANPARSKNDLPDFLEQLLVFTHPNATNAELNRIREKWVEQNGLNNKRIESTNGAVLKFNPSGSSTLTGIDLYYVYDYEEFGGAQVFNGPYMEGQIDYNCARFYAPYNYGGASILGIPSASFSGDVYVVGKLGPTGWGQSGNYFTVFGNNVADKDDPGWWENYIGYCTCYFFH